MFTEKKDTGKLILGTFSNKRIIKNTLFLYIRMFLTMGISLYTARVVLSILGVEDYGIYNVVGGIVIVLSFLNGAASASTNRFLTFELGRGDQKNLNDIFSASLNFHLIISVVVLLLGETIGLWFLYNKLNIPDGRFHAVFFVYQISLLNAIIVLTQVPYNAAIIAHENMNIYAYISLAESVLKLFVVYLLPIFMIDKLVLYALLLFIVSLIVAFFYRFYCTKKFAECRFRLVHDKALYIKLLSYSGWDLFGSLAVVCQGQGLNIVLNIFCGPAVNAARGITYQIHGAANLFVTNFLLASKPQIIKYYAGKKIDAMYQLFFRVTKYSLFLMTLIVLPVFFELPTILNIWLKEVPDYTLIFTRIILFSCLIQVIISSLNMVFHAIGRIRLGNTINGSLMITVLPLSYFLLKSNFPPQYTFLTMVSINVITLIIALFIIRSYEYYSILKYMEKVILPFLIVFIIGSIVPILIILFCNNATILRAILLFILTDVWIVILIWFLGLNTFERKKIKEIIMEKLMGINIRRCKF